ncbi:MAG: hypothetical protein L0Y57_14125 [Beijerinckiaceae bacterium]|nr:hypothetical protein [Beijerinckiaceae bacterium]
MPGDRVVMDGADRLRDGAKLSIAASEELKEGADGAPAPGGVLQKSGSPKDTGGRSGGIP